MFRTTIMIPVPLKNKAEEEAGRRKISFSELLRQALEKYLLSQRGITAHDPFLSSQTVFEDDGPRDVSGRHDHYLTRDPHGT